MDLKKIPLKKNIKLHVSLKTTEQLDKETDQFVVDLQRATWNNTHMLKQKYRGLITSEKRLRLEKL